MVARIAGDDLTHRLWHRLQEGAGSSGGRHDAEGVAVAPRVLRGQIAYFTLDPHLEQAMFTLELREPMLGVVGSHGPLAQFAQGEIAERSQDVAQAVRIFGGIAELLQEALVLGDNLRIEQTSELGFAQELSQTFVVDGQRLGTALGQWRIPLVYEVGDVRTRTRRFSMSVRIEIRPGKSNTSRKHSR